MFPVETVFKKIETTWSVKTYYFFPGAQKFSKSSNELVHEKSFLSVLFSVIIRYKLAVLFLNEVTKNSLDRGIYLYQSNFVTLQHQHLTKN